MSDLTIGILGFIALFGLMILRTPVAFAMLMVGFFGTWWIDGLRRAGAIMMTETYSSVANYSLIVIPMFILLGNVSSEAGFSRGLYDAAYAWVGRFRGGLATASVMGCAAFSAVSGSSVATAVTIGKVALPEMKRLGYGDGISTGSIAAGGTLGFLIPPSTGFVIYAILTEESIGRLFMAGVLPGALMMALFIVAIWVVTLIDPTQGPKGEKVAFAARMRALMTALPLLTVIIVSIGGIYLGVFTPVEASGVGAALTVILAFATRSIRLGGFNRAVMDTVRTTAMLYMIVVGANVLNPFLALTDIPNALGAALNAFGIGAYGTLLVILLSYVVLGMFLDGLAMLVITVPIYYPVIMALGFDPIWFGVIAVIVIEMGMITPPVGLNVFVVRNVAENVPLATVFRGVLPFLIAMIVCIILIILFPGIALLIPNSMFG
ncbi:TRAP transporter large permease [Pseudooceanicola sediminis]|uniref:TRAP transporter large permease protein n=1 Tax=Pseudooceanicola sediminis TaxID=2211117 RepID=A0A399J319_9RHOB|nr:TRAP transporter large permease [Pseudooceanicola sediminis]RII38859.1 TRAP transporter large permease [Pseudooceanicola sediminis]|tara:strand:- start:47734 stop:49038 length:1305 start_codon:yes stop_codon:yes gene_type:complete